MLTVRRLLSRALTRTGPVHCAAAALRADRRGVASLEFAIIAPVLLTMTIGAFDVGRAVIVWQEVQSAAKNIGQAAVILAAESSTGTGAATDSDLSPQTATNAMTTIYAVIPDTRTAGYATAGGIYSVTLTGVVYQNGNAYVIWSAPLTQGTVGLASVTRACGLTTQTASVPGNSTNLLTIPTLNVTITSPIVIADVHVRFNPTFFRFITGPVDFWESAYPPPITGGTSQEITYFNQIATNANVCANEPPPA